MAIYNEPDVIRKHPAYLRWQELIRSHPDGVAGVPLVAGEFPGRLVLIDCVGHKLVFPAAEVQSMLENQESRQPLPKGKAEKRADR